MTSEKVIEALRKISGIADAAGATEPRRMTPEEAEAPISILNRDVVLNHAKFLCAEAERMVVDEPHRIEKVMRWLGWLQGLCYGMGLTTIHGSKEMNRP